MRASWIERNRRYRGIFPLLAILAALGQGLGAAAGAVGTGIGTAASAAGSGLAGLASMLGQGAAAAGKGLAGLGQAAAQGVSGAGKGIAQLLTGGGPGAGAGAGVGAGAGAGLAPAQGAGQGIGKLLAGLGLGPGAGGGQGATGKVGKGVGDLLTGIAKAPGNAWNWWLNNPNPIDMVLPGLKGNVQSIMRGSQGIKITDMMADLKTVLGATEGGSMARFEGIKNFIGKYPDLPLWNLAGMNFRQTQPEMTPAEEAKVREQKRGILANLLRWDYTSEPAEKVEQLNELMTEQETAPSGVETPPPSLIPETSGHGMVSGYIAGHQPPENASSGVETLPPTLTPETSGHGMVSGYIAGHQPPENASTETGGRFRGHGYTGSWEEEPAPSLSMGSRGDQAAQRVLSEYFAERQSADKQRAAAVADLSNMVVNTGDGFQTTPKSYQDIGIKDADTAEQFQALESMIGKSLPEGFDLRKDFARDPTFYRELLKTIKEGVDDRNYPGHKRKLSREEILDLIQG